jgi:hypothetical protein
MKNLFTCAHVCSEWAKAHRCWSILAVITGKIILGITAFYSGIAMASEGFTFPDWTKWLIVVLGVAAYYCYPSTRRRRVMSGMQFYRRQKRVDFALILHGLLLFCFLGNLAPRWYANPPRPLYETSNLRSDPTFSLAIPLSETRHHFLKKGGAARWVWAKTRDHMQRRIGQIRSFVKERSVATKLILSLLLMMLSVLLSYLVAALACGIACSGSEILAYGVLIFGCAGIGFMLFKGMRNIWGKDSSGLDDRHKTPRKEERTRRQRQ